MIYLKNYYYTIDVKEYEASLRKKDGAIPGSVLYHYYLIYIFGLRNWKNIGLEKNIAAWSDDGIIILIINWI